MAGVPIPFGHRGPPTPTWPGAQNRGLDESEAAQTKIDQRLGGRRTGRPPGSRPGSRTRPAAPTWPSASRPRPAAPTAPYTASQRQRRQRADPTGRARTTRSRSGCRSTSAAASRIDQVVLKLPPATAWATRTQTLSRAGQHQRHRLQHPVRLGRPGLQPGHRQHRHHRLRRRRPSGTCGCTSPPTPAGRPGSSPSSRSTAWPATRTRPGPGPADRHQPGRRQADRGLVVGLHLRRRQRQRQQRRAPTGSPPASRRR